MKMTHRALPFLFALPLGACAAPGDGASTTDPAGDMPVVSALRGGDGEHGGGEATITATTRRLRKVRRVLLISVDGMHEVDAARFIAAHPDSTLAHLAGQRRHVHRCAYADAVGFLPRPARPRHRRDAEVDRRLLRRQLRPDAVRAGQQLSGQPGHGVHAVRDPREGLHPAVQPDRSGEPAAAEGRARELHAGLPARLHQGEYHLRGDPRGGRLHGLG